jgi:hypothetical protein
MMIGDFAKIQSIKLDEFVWAIILKPGVPVVLLLIVGINALNKCM